MSNAFEKKRQELLKQISSIKTQQKSKKKIESQATIIHSNSNVLKPSVAMFGSPTLFFKSIKELLEPRSQLHVFAGTTTEVIDTCAENQIINLIIDIDEPTGVKPAIEILGNLKAIQPDTVFICCTKDPSSKDAAIMVQKGGIVFGKPINASLLIKTLKRPVIKTENSESSQQEIDTLKSA
jgi:DNA-binding NtrC family response regulator